MTGIIVLIAAVLIAAVQLPLVIWLGDKLDH